MRWLPLWLALAGCDTVLFDAADLDDTRDLAPSSDLAPAASDGGAPDLRGPDLAPSLPFVSASNGDLYAGARRFRFIGANRYDVASFPPGSGKYYCGNAYSDAQLEQLVTELATSTGATVLRLWAFQSFTLGATDWSMIDRAIATAKRHGMRVILTLENEWKDCTQPDPSTADGRKGGAWFASGYLQPLGSYRLSYRDYVQAVVARYRDEPSVAMWQLMNEVESSDAAALVNFVTDMAGVVKFVDAKHLLSLGTIGSGQVGTQNANYRALHAIGGIDVVEAHDYVYDQALPGSPSSTSNSIYADLLDAKSLGKPFFIGECGMPAPTPMYAYTFQQRADQMDAKIGAHWSAGTDGFLIWSWYDGKSDNWQGWDVGPTDPLAAVLAKHAAETP
jgi:endo-1,4-beta-mannosidase